MQHVHSVVVMGSGPAGLTAALYAGRADLQPLVIQGGQPGGQLMRTSGVENWPGEIEILGPALMNKLTQHAIHCGAQLITGLVTKVELTRQPFCVYTNKNEVFLTRTLIIAAGSGPKKLNCPGEQEYWGKGVTTCAVCDGALYKDLPVVIVGGGNTAMHHALFMSRFTNRITIVHIHDELSASLDMRKQVEAHAHVDIRYNSIVTEIAGNGEYVTGVVIKDKKSGKAESLTTRAIFLAIGQQPNTQFLHNQLKLEPTGHIWVQTPTTHTSCAGVFACGDVIDTRYRQAITASATGCMAALDAQWYLEKS